MSATRAPMAVGQTKVNFDSAHGSFPDHADMITRLPGKMAQKLRVDGNGNILTDEIQTSRRSDL